MTTTQDWLSEASRGVEHRLTHTDLPLKPKHLIVTEETDTVGDDPPLSTDRDSSKRHRPWPKPTLIEAVRR